MESVISNAHCDHKNRHKSTNLIAARIFSLKQQNEAILINKKNKILTIIMRLFFCRERETHHIFLTQKSYERQVRRFLKIARKRV